jgi:acyl-coenzyme A thioesterase PaaI-like protein
VNTANKTYGTVSPERQKAISGLEFVQSLASGALPLNTTAQTLGYDVVEAGGRVGMAEGRVTDAKSRLLAHGTTTCPIFPS